MRFMCFFLSVSFVNGINHSFQGVRAEEAVQAAFRGPVSPNGGVPLHISHDVVGNMIGVVFLHGTFVFFVLTGG